MPSSIFGAIRAVAKTQQPAKPRWMVRATILVLAAIAANVAGAHNWGEDYARRIRATEAVAPLGDAMFGDQVNLFNGTVSFSATDISIPGNSALPVELSRSYDVRNTMVTGPLGSWELQVPHLVSVHPLSRPWAPADRCSTVAAPPVFGTFPNQFTAKDYWDGLRQEGESGDDDLLSLTPDPRL